MTDRDTTLSRSVRELQTALDFLARYDETLTAPIPDGIYGPATTESVRLFQEHAGLPITGNVDFATWNAIFTAYRKALAVAAPPLGIFPYLALSGAAEGETSDSIYLLQVMLRSLGVQYGAPFDTLPLTGTFDSDTATALRLFQRAQFLPETARLDRETWEALATVYNRYLETET